MAKFAYLSAINFTLQWMSFKFGVVFIDMSGYCMVSLSCAGMPRTLSISAQEKYGKTAKFKTAL